MNENDKIICPLYYDREISLGKCMDINYERLNHTKYDDMKDLTKITGKNIEELSEICNKCPNQPFPNGVIGKIIV